MGRRGLVMVVGIVVIVAGAIGFYLFRPDTLFWKSTVSEEFPAGPGGAQGSNSQGDAVQLLTGHFHPVAHQGTGVATIYQLPDGKRVLRLTAFDVDNGPDLYVYMVAAEDATDDATVEQAGYVSLGLLKGNRGDQNYELPADLDLNTYRSVSIWCQRFSVNFATAPLKPLE
ncbi:MAG: hypothetical protein KatS3mg057_2429 [Herpetosiphonaceae bacterium]|nr:MAG: hypothetical protein KatS3mg057_2429 [Herpetosiphonaceae bacterium]